MKESLSTKGLRVALVHDYLLRLGGAERVLNVLAEMFPEAPIYTLLYDAEKTGSIFPEKRIVTSGLQRLPNFIKKRYRYLLPLLPRYIEDFDFSEFDLVISSSTAFAHGIITSPHTKHICYMHSPVRYLWDWTHEYKHEQHLKGLKKMAVEKIMHGLRIWDFTASDRADMLIANSHHVQKRIKKYYRQESRVVYPPVDIERFSPSTTHEDFYLIVSTLSPYKKVDLAVDFFNTTEKKLVVIGEGAHRASLMNKANSNITFLGWQPDDVVRDYMMRCKALIFPGEEDFGITPVEAMACGKPVLAYQEGGVSESVIAGVTGEFFKEQTVESMKEGLEKLLQTTYNPLKMHEHAQKFSTANFRTAIEELVAETYSQNK
ncbi:glycosyltransferase [Candidatus Gracilibacteria bacterium]|nr:glycosyltransferase [Candidatus Gracilibacteria bacterium]